MDHFRRHIQQQRDEAERPDASGYVPPIRGRSPILRTFLSRIDDLTALSSDYPIFAPQRSTSPLASSSKPASALCRKCDNVIAATGELAGRKERRRSLEHSCQCTVAFHASVQKVPTLHVPQVPSSKRYHDMSPYCRYHRVDSARTIQQYLIALTGVDRRDRMV